MGRQIMMTERQFRVLIREAVRDVVNEYDQYDPDEDFNDGSMPESAQEDFRNSGFEETLRNKFPEMDFEFNVDNNGTVTVIDTDSGKYYTCEGDIEYETVGMGYSSPNDYDVEEEGEVAYYDFYNCLKTIMQKIDEDKPDGMVNR